jgi:hypothetical protein
MAVYSLDTKEYRKLMVSGSRPLWLDDSRRLLFNTGEALCLTDVDSESVHEVFSVSPDRLTLRPSISSDNRTLYFTRSKSGADIWLLTFEQDQ